MLIIIYILYTMYTNNNTNPQDTRYINDNHFLLISVINFLHTYDGNIIQPNIIKIYNTYIFIIIHIFYMYIV